MALFTRFISTLFALVWLASSALSAEVGSITLLVGQAHIERGTEKLSVANGIAIEERDSVITASNARVQITFNDQTVITLGSQSRLSVKEFLLSDSQAPKANFSITQGAFKAITGKIGKIAPQNFKLETKTATIGIRGTIIEGRVGIDEDIIQCIQGSIIVSSLNPSLSHVAPVIVEAGEMTIVGINTPPAPAAPIPEGGMGLVSSASQESQENQATEGETSAQGEASQATSEGEATASTNKEGSTPASSENQSTASTTQATPAERQAGANTSSSQAPSTPSTLAGDSLASLGSVAQPSQERGSDTNQTRKVEEQIKNLTPPEPEPLPEPEPKPEEKPKPEPIPDTGNHGNQGGGSSGSGSGGSGGSSSGGSSSGSNSSGSGGGGGSSGGSSSGSVPPPPPVVQNISATPHAVTDVPPFTGDTKNLLRISQVKWMKKTPDNSFTLAYIDPQNPSQSPAPTLEIIAESDNPTEQIIVDGNLKAFILQGVTHATPHSTPGGRIYLAGGIPMETPQSTATNNIAQMTSGNAGETGELAINYATKEVLQMTYDSGFNQSDFNLFIGKIGANGEIEAGNSHHLKIKSTVLNPSSKVWKSNTMELRLYGEETNDNYILGGHTTLAHGSSNKAEFIAGKMKGAIWDLVPGLYGDSSGEVNIRGFGASTIGSTGWNPDGVTIKMGRSAFNSGDALTINLASGGAIALSSSHKRAYITDQFFAAYDVTNGHWIAATPQDSYDEYTSWGYWGNGSGEVGYWVAGHDKGVSSVSYFSNPSSGLLLANAPRTLRYTGKVMGHLNKFESGSSTTAIERVALENSSITLNFEVGGGQNAVAAGSKLELHAPRLSQGIKDFVIPIRKSIAGQLAITTTPLSNPNPRSTFKAEFGNLNGSSVAGGIQGEFYGNEAQAIGGAFGLKTNAGTNDRYEAVGVFHGRKQL